MNWQQLFDEIQRGSFRRVYLFQGPEEYIKRSAVEKLRQAILPPGLELLNESIIEGGDARRVIENAETLPVMSEKRLLIVRDFPPLTSGKAKDEQAQADQLSAWVANAPDATVTVFYMRDQADSRKKLTKAIQKDGCVVDFDALSDAQILKWVRAQIKPFHKTIDEKAVSALTFRAGRLLTVLSAEIGKLCAYTEDRPVITEDDIVKTVTPSPEATVFLMIDTLMDGSPDEAFRMLARMLETGESRVGALAMLTRQMRIMTHVCLLQRDGLPQAEIERQTGLTRYVLSRVYGRCARMDSEVLLRAYRECVDGDFAIKSGKMRDQAALDRVMLSLAEIFAKNVCGSGTK